MTQKQRPSVDGLRTEPLSIVRVGFIGLGARGMKALLQMAAIPQVRMTALCDTSAERLSQALAALAEQCAGKERPDCTNDSSDICRQTDVDLVYVCTDWASHAAICVEAMRHGKHVAVEVPAALTLEDIRLIVRTAEESQRHCILLENCCFEPQVEEAVAAIRAGKIGEVVHAEGNYYHTLGDRWTRWRLDTNRRYRGDLYPTHELGPICQALGIGRDDRLQTLVSMDSAALTGPLEYERATGEVCPDFQNGDHTTTLIRTERGRTILLKHNVLTPQPYERQLSFIGTKGVIRLNDEGSASHAEMTLRMNQSIIHSLTHGLPMPISVYDLATWCAVGPLSRRSIEGGFVPVQFPRIRE